MRQLDLFGSLIDNPQDQTNEEEKKAVAKKEESKNEGTSDNGPANSESILNDTSHTANNEVKQDYESQGISTYTSTHEAATTDSFAETEIDSETISSTISAEEAEILLEQLAAGAEQEIEVLSQDEPEPEKQETLPSFRQSGAVIFDDGKITVKIKNKPVVTAIAEKERKVTDKKTPQKRGRKSFQEIDAEIDLIEIPEDEILFQKQYYPISEVAGWFRVNTSLLRFWENEFDVLKPRKNRKGDRLFRPEDVKNLQLIYQLLRQRKYTLEGAKEYIKTNGKKADIQLQLTTTLQKFKSFLLDLKANLQS